MEQTFVTEREFNISNQRIADDYLHVLFEDVYTKPGTTTTDTDTETDTTTTAEGE